MNNNHLRKNIRSLIRNVLLEQEKEQKSTPEESTSSLDKSKDDKKEKKKSTSQKITDHGNVRIASGAVGSGRFQNFVGAAGARAKKDPSGLMKDLGIRSASGANDLEKTLSIVNAAIHTNNDMAEAYSGANIAQEQTHEGEMIKVIGVYPSGINSRNGIKFLSHTLQGAINAGLIILDGSLEINKGRNSPIVIYVV
jgi:hypothetical protein